ncbi:MAG TPA: hypothetical protein VGO93_19095 [Candidatus Xenobia bacterium]|jgi:Spy/CpxP family protein refolding chaperone
MRTWAGAALALVMLMGAAGQAQAPAPPAAAAKGGHNIWDHQKELGLTDKQVTDMKAAAKTFQDQINALQAKDKTLEPELRTLVSNDASDVNKLKSKLMEQASLRVDFQVDQLTMSRSIKKILTPDQVKKWTAMVNAHRPASPMSHMIPPPPPPAPKK